MKKRKPDKAERVARKLVVISRIGKVFCVELNGWVIYGLEFNRREKLLCQRRYMVERLASALRKAGVKGR